MKFTQWTAMVCFVGSLIALSGCVFVPFGQRDPLMQENLVDQQPILTNDLNPLDSSNRLEVVCGPQRAPLIETDEVKLCEEDPDCRVVCAPESLEPSDGA